MANRRYSYSDFRKLKYVHVTIDTFSGFLVATALTGGATKNVINHCLCCFSMLGVPNQIKTGNGTGYFSQAFETFCGELSITHITGIPYTPQGQDIVKRAHQTLKNIISNYKIVGGILYPTSGNQKNLLNHALFVLNFLTLDNEGRAAADRLWHPSTSQNYAQAIWKDPLTNKWQAQTLF